MSICLSGMLCAIYTRFILVSEGFLGINIFGKVTRKVNVKSRVMIQANLVDRKGAEVILSDETCQAKGKAQQSASLRTRQGR